MAELIQTVVAAPVVSDDSNSPEAKMAREAKELQVQSATDAKFDTVLKRDGTPVSASQAALKESFADSPLSYSYSSLALLGLSFGIMAFLGNLFRKA